MNYDYYAMVADSEKKNINAYYKVMDDVDCFDNFKSPEEVKEYLKNTYGIEGNVNNFTAWNNCFLSTEDTDEFFLVKLDCYNESKLYYYNK